MEVFAGLLHDAGSPDAESHRALLDRPDGWTVGPLVVDDGRLAGLPGDVALSVVTAGGAGGVAALARRAGSLALVAVESVLRDLDDLAGNAARVVAAAGELGDGVEVFVGLPAAPGLVAAVETVEAAGLRGRVDLGASAGAGASALLSLLVEADLPFKVTGLGPDPFGPYGVVALLMAVEALVDGAEADEADALLEGGDERRALAGLGGWDAAAQARVARRLRGVDSPDVAAVLDRLGAAGLLER